MKRRLLRWRTAKPLRRDSRLRGRETDFDRLSRAHRELLDQLNNVYVEMGLYLQRQDRKQGQTLVVDGVGSALGQTDAATTEGILAEAVRDAQAFLHQRAEWTTRWGGRSRITPLHDDSLVRHGLLSRVSKAHPEPVNRLNQVYLEAQLYLRRRDLDTCLEIIRSAIRVAEEEPDNAEEMLRTEVGRATDFLNDRAQQTARRVYATGLYLGVVISAAVLSLIALVAILVDIPPDALSKLRDVLACVGGGAVGAVVSTILRVSNTDAFDYRVVTLRTASFRIVLGWLFATALLFLVDGGIVTVFKVPAASSAESFFFWGGVGFLGGFNEVWARNLVTRGSDPNASKSPPEK